MSDVAKPSRRNRSDDNHSDDYPIYSRIFIVCERSLSESDFEETFSKYGTIEDLRMPRDHNTGNSKGVVYIKYSKTSEAAAAIEAMHQKNLKTSSRPLKVMVATNRSDIKSDEDGNLKYTRLFLTVPKIITEDELQKEFEKFGRIDTLQVQRDRQTGESKGFAYVKYRRFSDAARAYEDCDKKYRALFAAPKNQNKRSETTYESYIGNLGNTSSNLSSIMSMMTTKPGRYKKVDFMCCPHLTQGHIEALFNIVPGMVNCQFFVDLMRNFGKGTVSYSNPISAAYAVERLNKFEYPPGLKIFVRPNNSQFDPHEHDFSNVTDVTNNLRDAIKSAGNSNAPDLAQLADAVAKASKLIKQATAGATDEHVPDSNDFNYCSVQLPPPQPLADIDCLVVKRCFLVCKPQPPPLTVLRDVFCRFGDLINVYTLPHKTVGYARYASVKSADEAIAKLHGAEICGVRIKVLEAEEETPAKKRRNHDFDRTER